MTGRCWCLEQAGWNCPSSMRIAPQRGTRKTGISDGGRKSIAEDKKSRSQDEGTGASLYGDICTTKAPVAGRRKALPRAPNCGLRRAAGDEWLRLRAGGSRCCGSPCSVVRESRPMRHSRVKCPVSSRFPILREFRGGCRMHRKSHPIASQASPTAEDQDTCGQCQC